MTRATTKKVAKVAVTKRAAVKEKTDAPSSRRAARETRPVEQAKPKRQPKVKETDEPKGRRARATKTVEEPTRKTRSSKSETSKPARAGREKAKPEVEEKATRSCALMAFDKALDDQLDGIEKDYSLTSSSVDNASTRLSTGMLALDLILGRGVVPGWYTLFGPEQSCKSTGATTLIAAALETDVPVISWWDYEGSSSGDYIESILKTLGIKSDVEHIFGLRNPATQAWEVKPRVRYYSEGVAEKFFDYIAKLERMLPDKVQMNDKWYLVYPGKVKNAQGKEVGNKVGLAIVKDDYDKNYFRKTGNYRVEADNDSLQALVVLDSYPAMLPEKQDVDDPNSAIGVQARMFSDQIKRVKGKLRAKRIAVVGVNQLRLKPMVMYGSPEYEPCGETLKFFSDVRLKMSPRALSAVPGGAKGKGYIEEEDSVAGEGVDNYRYINVRAHKNKLSTPNLEGWLRLWITNSDGQGCGFDPVWDTWYYLTQTGQVTGKRNSMKITIKGHESGKSLSWMDFKTLVLGSFKEMKTVCEDARMKPFKIREFCKKQLGTGNGVDMYYAAKKAGHAADADEDGASDEE